MTEDESLSPSELRFNKIQNVLTEISETFTQQIEEGQPLDTIINNAFPILETKPLKSDISHLQAFTRALTDYYHHIRTQPRSIEHAYKGAQMYFAHLEFMTQLLESSTRNPNQLNLCDLVKVQESLNGLFSPFLEQIQDIKRKPVEIKSMNSAMNALIYFKSAFPHADIKAADIGADVHHKIDLIVTTTHPVTNEPFVFYTLLKTAKTNEVWVRPLKTQSDIVRFIPPVHHNEVSIAWHYLQSMNFARGQLLYIQAPHQTYLLEDIQQQAQSLPQRVSLAKPTPDRVTR